MPSTKDYLDFILDQLSELNCNGFEAVDESPIDFIKKQDPNSNIWIIGGNTILAPLLENDLIDHLIIQVAPVLLGAGIQLFTQKEDIHRYTLAKVTQYGQFAELVLNRQNTSLAEEIPS